jgi:ATP-dependent DNA helicase DinG
VPLTLHDLLIPGTDPDVLARYETLAERAQTATFGILEDEYVVLDTETTGFNPKRDRLIEVAAAIMRGPEIVERFSTFVNPGCAIPPEIVELTGITEGDVADAPGPDEVLEELEAFVGDRKIIAHNAPFDRGFIAANARFGSRLGDEDRWMDSVELARIALPRLREYKLPTLSEVFCPAASTHRAIDDVEALCSLWRILLVGISDLPLGLPALMAELFPKTLWPLREVFSQVAGSMGDARFSLADARRAREHSQLKREKIDAQDLAAGFGSFEPIDQAELDEAFSASGLLAEMYEQFEPRREQLLMATEVNKALASKTHRVIEAGTGVGKSMAYLLPLILFSQRNQVTCGVATKTNTLLDQLMYHELPRLNAALPDKVSYVALKGYDHYPCLRKLMNTAHQDRTFENTGAPTVVATLLSFVCQSARGDLDQLALFWRDLPRFEVVASADDCLHYKCRYYQHCLLHGARRAAKQADIVLTNHALLFCDVVAGGGILPPVRQWVIDEAHGVESEARSQLSFAVEARALKQTLDGLLRSGGALSTMQRTAEPLGGSGVLTGRISETQEDARALLAIADSFFSQLKELCEIAEQSSYNQVELWINVEVRESAQWGTLASIGSSLVGRMDKLWSACRDIVSQSAQFEELLEVQGDLAGLTAELRGTYESLVLILDGTNEDYVYYCELDRRPDNSYDRLIASRVDIGDVLNERFFPEEMSVIFTSATLAAGESFEYFARGCGLDDLAPELWSGVQLDSSYDFESNMAVYLPTDMPEPTARDYRDALEELIFAVHTALGGSTLTLFTNRRDMDLLYERLNPRLAEEGITLRCQTRGFSPKRLRDEFLENKELSLFALRSFWEGFDAPGDTLRCVIIPKLPFGKPNDPLMKERERRGENAWKNYALPEAIIDLKQAAGRLIRSSTDSGSLVLADARLLTKWYGRAFLDALPSQQRYTLDTQALADALKGRQ